MAVRNNRDVAAEALPVEREDDAAGASHAGRTYRAYSCTTITSPFLTMSSRMALTADVESVNNPGGAFEVTGLVSVVDLQLDQAEILCEIFL